MDSTHQFSLALAEIASEAGRIVLGHFRQHGATRRKPDGSPVTEADEEAEAFILSRLAAIAADIPVIAEEQMARGTPAVAARRFFLVDALDGTKEFIAGHDGFTVNIALVEERIPVCGTVVAPAVGRAFVGERSRGAFEFAVTPFGAIDPGALRPIRARSIPAAGPTIVVSRTHGEGEAESFAARAAQVIRVASSLKFGLLAAGEADFYPRRGPTMEWDTAAGQAVLEAAGGRVETETGELLRYGKANASFRNPEFIARGLV
jgi:3'(2'), 5'-bisphosphate nucleotidase